MDIKLLLEIIAQCDYDIEQGKDEDLDIQKIKANAMYLLGKEKTI